MDILEQISVYSYFPGFQNQDVAFYHVASKSLVVADLIFNLPGTEQVCISSPLP